MKHKSLMVIILLTIVMILTGCNRTRLTEEEITEMEKYAEMLLYATVMGFANRRFPKNENRFDAEALTRMVGHNFNQRITGGEITDEWLSHYTKVVIVHRVY